MLSRVRKCDTCLPAFVSCWLSVGCLPGSLSRIEGITWYRSMRRVHVTIPVSHGVWGEILLDRSAGVGRKKYSSSCGVTIIMMPNKESIFYALLVSFRSLVSGSVVPMLLRF